MFTSVPAEGLNIQEASRRGESGLFKERERETESDRETQGEGEREGRGLFGLSNIFISVPYSDWREEKHSALEERELHKMERGMWRSRTCGNAAFALLLQEIFILITA